MDFTDPSFLVFALVAASILFALVAFFTRATRRHIAGALAASAPLIPLVMLYDIVGTAAGWWHYPSLPGALAPFALYVVETLWFGAALGLIGWRVRQLGRYGLVLFLIGVSAIGVVRDRLYASMTGLFALGPGAVPLLAEFTSYFLAAALVQFFMARFLMSPLGRNWRMMT